MHLENTALVFLGPEERHFHLFLYATQNPQLVVFAPLRPYKEYAATPQEPDGTHAFPVHHRWNFVFKVDYAHQVTSESFPSHVGATLALLFHIIRLGGGFALCASEYVPFDGWTEGLEDPRGEGQLSRAKDGGMSEEALKTDLWRQMLEELYVGW